MCAGVDGSLVCECWKGVMPACDVHAIRNARRVWRQRREMGFPFLDGVLSVETGTCDGLFSDLILLFYWY